MSFHFPNGPFFLQTLPPVQNISQILQELYQQPPAEIGMLSTMLVGDKEDVPLLAL